MLGYGRALTINLPAILRYYFRLACHPRNLRKAHIESARGRPRDSEREMIGVICISKPIMGRINH